LPAAWPSAWSCAPLLPILIRFAYHLLLSPAEPLAKPAAAGSPPEPAATGTLPPCLGAVNPSLATLHQPSLLCHLPTFTEVAFKVLQSYLQGTFKTENLPQYPYTVPPLDHCALIILLEQWRRAMDIFWDMKEGVRKREIILVRAGAQWCAISKLIQW